MTKLTKALVFVILLSVIMTAYAFGYFLDSNVKPLPEPLNLLIVGCAMFAVGHFLRHITNN